MKKVAYVKYVPEVRATGVTVPSEFSFLQRKWCHKVRVKICLTGTMMAAWPKHLVIQVVTVIYFSWKSATLKCTAVRAYLTACQKLVKLWSCAETSCLDKMN